MKNILIGIIAITLLQGCTGNVSKTAEPMKKYPAFDIQNMDTTIKPGDDFFTYTNGKWLKNNPIPADKNAKDAFDELIERNRDNIKEIIIDAASSGDSVPGSNKQKIGTFYKSGMDTVKIEEQGIKPLKVFFDKIESIKTIDDVQMTAAFFQSYSISPFFYLFSNQDSKNSNNVIAQCYQSGLGLPERDYYFNNDESTKKIREKYLIHLTKMFELLKDQPAVAEKNARTVMSMETQLAKASFTNVENQDPQKTYNKFDIEGLNKLSQNIKWTAYFASTGYSDLKEINIYQPGFFKELGNMMKSVSVNDWKTFLRWHLINSTASYLSKDFENQKFDFYYTTLSGQEKMEPRWKLVLDETSGSLGEAIGQLYVEKFFPPVAKERMTALVMNLKTSLKQRIENLAWMGPQTKQEALAKLDNMRVKVGYPNKWRDYSGLEITPDSYVMNVLNSQAFEFRYMMNKVGKPVDREAWGMTPQTVNAGYYPNKNEIVFPAGILQPPFFNLDADDAVNYGAIGMVIGHEMTHGFDNQGRQFDKDGNLRDWWTKDDAKAFEDRASMLIDQYNHFEVLDSAFVNGKLTLGENIADLGGATISFNAYKLSLKGKVTPKPIDGFTDTQRFFLSYAQIWRNNMRDAELRKRIKTDEHSPAKVRINGVV
ncbi:MAG TPA: M13 family metallopeptidase, partial [Bacteroidales bacterium]|nr:M13 family metallopeptidase [Bacteroidales bacterium]